mmetsp:Transcript_35065/g.43276  ORF Transcript_35065/g.43276 Transcript_35065/m.43276 type:complete len:408 (+) Transcript_35065:115-1338(+)
MDESTKNLLLTFLDFGVPSTNPVNFCDVIDITDLRDGAKSLLRLASDRRQTLEDGLSYEGSKVDPRNVIASVNVYLESVWAVQESLEYSAQTRIKLKGPLEFTWTSVLCSAKNRGKKGFTNQVFVFEVCYVLVVRALAHYNNSFILCKEADGQEPMNRENLISAVKDLRVSSGILKYVANTLLPRWQSPPHDKPPEVFVEVLESLSKSFLCMAQRITIVSVLMKGDSVNKSLIVKLFLGLEEHYQGVVTPLSTLPKQVREKDISPTLFDEPATFAIVANALAWKYMAIDAHSKIESSDRPDILSGKAAAFIAHSYTKLKNCKLGTGSKHLRHVVDAEIADIGAKYTEYQTDNEKVYFGIAPDMDDVELPQRQFLPTAVEFEMPKVDVVSFASKSGCANDEIRLAVQI